jgi:hypothetical protein
MHKSRITRTSDLDSILSFLKSPYPLLSEAEIIKMALSNQYYQETGANQRADERQQDPTKRFTPAEWQKKFAAFEHMRDQVTLADEEQLDQAIDTAVRAVRAESINAYEKNPAKIIVVDTNVLIRATFRKRSSVSLWIYQAIKEQMCILATSPAIVRSAPKSKHPLPEGRFRRRFLLDMGQQQSLLLSLSAPCIAVSP